MVRRRVRSWVQGRWVSGKVDVSTRFRRGEEEGQRDEARTMRRNGNDDRRGRGRYSARSIRTVCQRKRIYPRSVQVPSAHPTLPSRRLCGSVTLQRAGGVRSASVHSLHSPRGEAGILILTLVVSCSHVFT